ncbi:MAG: DUF3127 domain-containing protein [Saprospiraceae bacterium]|nr:MAG: hypothetical protein UZ09_BCD002000516 [Bacteroidetes bacterium OLB9]MCO6464922.1 DUF3127 domain-containing protein [Saprospiraceae bacterium]MCZ2337326.1 DUF3127 domain-containing protein [Chitinophagales bacterium]
MAFEISGVLHKIFDIEKKTDTFQTREFVIKTEETYPQFVKFQAVQDRCNIIDGYNEGDKIKVSFDLRGREWQDKYFTNLNAWKVERAGAQQSQEVDTPPFNQNPFSDEPSSPDGGLPEDFDDLPF